MKRRVTVLTGGVGGAKLVLGLQEMLDPETVTAVVNTGDDFRHLGLFVSPDIDTLVYTLAGKANAAQGWGREGETWSFMEAVRSLGGEAWFQLGDGDLALHVQRSHALSQGKSLSAITRQFAKAWGIRMRILPMTNDRVMTYVTTDHGDLPFQRYFVEQRCAPAVRSIQFEGAADASPAPGVIDAIMSPDVEAVLLAPSNPWLSVDPILAIPGIREALTCTRAPVVAVSPIVGGEAVKGPTAKLMRELGFAVTNDTIVRHYAGIVDGLVVDHRDELKNLPITNIVTDTLMKEPHDRARVVMAALKLARELAA